MPHITQFGYEGAQWACGYRNIQMLCVSLMQRPEFKRVLFNGSGDVPDVDGIQAWLEKAWHEGFDEVVSFIFVCSQKHELYSSHEKGASQLDGALLGQKKWIGTSSVAHYFSCFLFLV
jgi:hypothetical protein